MNFSLQVLESVFAFYSNSLQLCFNGFIFEELSAIVFALQIFCWHAKAPVEVEFAIEPEVG